MPDRPADGAAPGAPAAGPRPVVDDPDTTSPVPGRSLPDGWGSYDDFRQLFEQAPVPMALIDLAARTLFPNPAYRRLLGYEGEAADRLEGYGVVHPDQRDEAAALHRALLRGEVERISVDRRYVRADGSELPVHVVGSLLRRADGTAWALLLVVHDLTERRAAEQGRADSEARLQALLANAADAIVVLDGEAVVLDASPAAARLIGQPVEDRLGTSALDLVHPDDLGVVTRSFLGTAATPGVAVPLRFRLQRPDGAVRLVEAVATNLLADPAVAGVVVNLRDLTDHARVETALEVAEARWRSMLENISDTVTLVDGAGSVVATTGNLKEILGYPTAFWDLRNGFDIVHPDDVPLVEARFAELLAEPGAEVTGEFRVRQDDGAYAEVEGTAVNLLDDPSVAAVVLTTRNITARKEIERELAEARDRAVGALALRNEFLANVGHELRTPVHGILGLAELLATAELDEGARSLAQAIVRATAGLELVLDDLLDHAKLEADRLELVHEPVDVAELVDELVTLFGAQATGKGVGLVADVPGELPTVVTDGFRLRQVLANLLSNAVKFTPAGEVAIAVAVQDGGDGRRRLAVDVRDTGIGIAPDDRERLFEPFSQAHASTSRSFGGTGLGLAISRRLIDLMGGTLEVDSEPGRGSTFRILLPLVEAEDGQRTLDGRRAVPADGGGRRVLVAEDNPVNQLLVRHQLERLGYEPTVVGGGSEAVERYRAAGADAVLLDCQMPGLDGRETARQLREVERQLGRARVPVVALTANALPGERARCLEAGMDDFLAKPVGLQPLGACLQRWLPVATPSGPAEGGAGAADDPAPSVGVALDQLAEELGDRAAVVGVVHAFRRELPTRLDRLRTAAAEARTDDLAAAAHVLAGGAAVVGGEAVAAACRRIEAAPAAADAPVAAVLAAAPALDRALLGWLEAGPDPVDQPGAAIR